jgi:hypothetical protein
MGSIDEQILRATKEIVVKFIEAGRISPSGFHETFKDIYHTVEKTTKQSINQSGKEADAALEKKDKLEKKNKKKS